ncbi:MAG TPA: phosphorylase, partial [Cyanobacteria bacterium UBA11372]|nr:phosphorylase [Cyanobacteria bacterium UBA11372]
MVESNLISAIIVAQGAEYQAVCRGLSRLSTPTPPVLPIPMGPKPLTQYLENLQNTGHFFHPQSRILLMGLCGSLTPSHKVGDVVLYKSCIKRWDETRDEKDLPLIPPTLPLPLNCDRYLTSQIHAKLAQKAAIVKALTSDRFVNAAASKRLLSQMYQADVIDMEGFAALEMLSQAGIAVAMVRVIGDDCDRDMPDLSTAVSPNGSLQLLPLAISMIRQPFAAKRLIQGS